MIFDDILGHTSFNQIKKLRLHNVDILEKFLKDQTLNQKYIAKKDDLEILR